MERTIEMYNGMVWGEKVSNYGLEVGYLDYQTLAAIVGDCIMNNTVREATMFDWEIATGELEEEVCQEYIISEHGFKFLRDYTDEVVFYNEELDIYVWAITHTGTAWSYVSTGIKLVDCDI